LRVRVLKHSVTKHTGLFRADVDHSAYIVPGPFHHHFDSGQVFPLSQVQSWLLTLRSTDSLDQFVLYVVVGME